MQEKMTQQLRDGVREAYSAVSERPQEKHPFPVGQRFAESVGYPQDLLYYLPIGSTVAFAGVSNVAVFADIAAGSTVLDLGCGAGVDCLTAAKRVEPDGRVIGVDFSGAMLARARQATAEAGADNVELHQADAENLPFGDGTIDLVLVNGIFNLNPKRKEIFSELARVVRVGGAVYAAELILKDTLPPEIQASEAEWFA
jgi:SAM-dependent methyltransferase